VALVAPVSGVRASSTGAGGASGATVVGDASCGGVEGSIAGAGASVAVLGDSGTGCDASGTGVSSEGISRFYRIAGPCLW